jgi:lipopolysaccharide/colanic/teichoic acid biosynthesis glycosyltransferase
MVPQLERRASRARTERGRRLINVSVALLGLAAAAPLMLLIAVLIKLTSRGPIFYTQVRVGMNRRAPGEPAGNSRRHVDYGGRLFTMYKFRTMSVNADRAGQVWASPDDPRTTLVGKVLRKYRLDEIPQLVNVLKGDMNVVGPRPEQPRIFVNLRAQIDRYEERQAVLPGITGWAQINQHYDRCVDDVRQKLMLDIHYVQRRCALMDLQIMLRTLPVVVFQRGAW